MRTPSSPFCGLPASGGAWQTEVTKLGKGVRMSGLRIVKTAAAVVAALVILAVPQRLLAAVPGCGQAQVETLLGAPSPPGPSPVYIEPRREITPFYQWESNDGYCGEVSLISSGMVNGQWMSQFNARLVCGAFFGRESDRHGASLLQAGNPPTAQPNYNAQLLIENPATGVSGEYDFAHAWRCGTNARLATTTYPYATGFLGPNQGLAGYRDYMSWIKAQVIAGNQVTVAVLFNGGSDPQYDHEVSVLRIGTHHAADDARYYDDDVLVFEDHGAYTLTHRDGVWAFAWNPSVPYGAGADTVGCTPYVFAYRFDALPHTRTGANAAGAPGYSMVIPGDASIVTQSGNTGPDGNGTVTIDGPHNYAFAVSGPIDEDGVTRPVNLRITGSRSLQGGEWKENPRDEQSSPAAGYDYETPYIGGNPGHCNQGQCVSNVEPPAMLVTLEATVSGLQAGRRYNLYEYEFPPSSGADTGAAAALAVPTAGFNRNWSMASAVTPFTATGADFTRTLDAVPSDRVVVFRAVPADAP